MKNVHLCLCKPVTPDVKGVPYHAMPWSRWFDRLSRFFTRQNFSSLLELTFVTNPNPRLEEFVDWGFSKTVHKTVTWITISAGVQSRWLQETIGRYVTRSSVWIHLLPNKRGVSWKTVRCDQKKSNLGLIFDNKLNLARKYSENLLLITPKFDHKKGLLRNVHIRHD